MVCSVSQLHCTEVGAGVGLFYFFGSQSISQTRLLQNSEKYYFESFLQVQYFMTIPWLITNY